jgi:hypothetical protein
MVSAHWKGEDQGVYENRMGRPVFKVLGTSGIFQIAAKVSIYIGTLFRI